MKIKPYIIVFCLFLRLTFAGQSQTFVTGNHAADSIIREAAKLESDEDKVGLYGWANWELVKAGDHEKVYEFVAWLKKNFTTHKNWLFFNGLEADQLLTENRLEEYQKTLENTRKFIEEHKDEMEEKDYKKALLKYYLKNENAIEDNLQAIKIIKKALVLSKEINDERDIAACYYRLGWRSVKDSQYSAAKDYVMNGLEVAEENDFPYIQSNMYSTLANIALSEKRHEEALVYLEKNYKLCMRNEHYYTLAIIHNVAIGNMIEAERTDIVQKTLDIFEMDDLEGFLEIALANAEKTNREEHYKLMLESAVSLSHLFLDQKIASKHYQEYRSVLNEFETVNNDKVRKEMEAQLNTAEIEQEAKETKAQKRMQLLWFALAIVALLGLLLFLYQRKKLADKNNQLTSQKNEELQLADEMKSRFFTNISHELRTPLTLVMGPLQEIMEKDKINNPKQVKTLLNLSLVNARRINDRINEILNLSRLESNKISIENQPVGVNKFLKRVIFAFESVTILRQINVEYKAEFEQDLVLSFDKNKVETILNNMLSNAIKHSPNGASIQVVSSHSNSELMVQVLDEGPGIKADESEKVFDRFYQTTEGKEKGGTGIGLAFSRELARVMEGSLVNLPMEKGAKFELKIASQIAEQLVEEVITESNEELNFEPEDYASKEEKPVVLVVEDNPEMRSYISLILEKYYKVHQAVDGNEALSVLKTKHIDIITSDLMMDGMDGFELMEALKEDKAFKHIPLIMLTARADEKDKLSALELGVDDYLLKPFKADELLARIKNLLSNIKERTKGNESKEEVNAADHEFLKKVQELISTNLKNPIFGIEVLCEELGVSGSTLNRKIRSLKGLSGAAFIKEVRLSRAYYLLINKKLDSVKEVSNACGFSRPNYFAKEFYKRFGKKPGEYFID